MLTHQLISIKVSSSEAVTTEGKHFLNSESVPSVSRLCLTVPGLNQHIAKDAAFAFCLHCTFNFHYHLATNWQVLADKSACSIQTVTWQSASKKSNRKEVFNAVPTLYNQFYLATTKCHPRSQWPLLVAWSAGPSRHLWIILTAPCRYTVMLTCSLLLSIRWQAHVAPGRHRGLDRNVSGSQGRCLGSHSKHRRHQSSDCCCRLHSVSSHTQTKLAWKRQWSSVLLSVDHLSCTHWQCCIVVCTLKPQFMCDLVSFHFKITLNSCFASWYGIDNRSLRCER